MSIWWCCARRPWTPWPRPSRRRQEAGEPFQVVHFDGHGVLEGRRAAGSGAPGMYQDPAPEGVLVFQAADGGRDPVPASRVAQVLAAARVPVVVLNACQSGAVGKQLEAAVATRLLHGGAASVVAMAYSVYAVAAAEFMAAFYERLFAGDTVSAAVTAGRQRLFRHPGRPSPKGTCRWPTGWCRCTMCAGRCASLAWSPPALRARRRWRRRWTSSPMPGPAARGGVLAPVGVFTGRDGLFYELETAARLQKVVMLHGPGRDREDRAGQGVRPVVARHRRGGAGRVGVLAFLRARAGLLRPGRGDHRDRPGRVRTRTSPGWMPRSGPAWSSASCGTGGRC